MTLTPIAPPTLLDILQPLRVASNPVDSFTDQSNNASPQAAGPFGKARSGFAAALSRAALAWHRPHLTEQQVMQAITDSAAALLPAAVGAAVLTRHGTGPLQLTASAGVIPPRVQSLQLERGNHPVPRQVVRPRPAGPIAASRNRSGWPIATTTTRGGFTAITYVPLGLGNVMFGTLLINTATPITADTEICAVTVAIHACTAISAAQQRDRLRDAVDTRDVIGKAKGILMERNHTTSDAAFAELLRISTLTHTNLRDLCSFLCATGELPALRTGPDAN